MVGLFTKSDSLDRVLGQMDCWNSTHIFVIHECLVLISCLAAFQDSTLEILTRYAVDRCAYASFRLSLKNENPNFAIL